MTRSVSLLARMAVVAGLLIPPLSAADSIDWDKARVIYQKVQQGQEVSAEDRAYLEKAKALRAAQGGQAPRGQVGGRPVKAETGFIPLPELTGNYKGQDGGLYGAGQNLPPPALDVMARAAMARITPLDAEGKPNLGGKVVLLSIGMSNTTMEFSGFVELAKIDKRKADAVVVVDGAQGGQSADRIADEAAPFWKVIDQRLASAGVSPKQVQAIWMKQAFPGPREEFPVEARRLAGYLEQDIAIARKRYPNLRIIYLSSRIYAGFATTGLNPEPHAYEGAFAVRWTILKQLEPAAVNSDSVLLWGPYLWADGIRGRKEDGLVWKAEDFAQDGTHPGPGGGVKVAEQLLGFFHTSPYAAWYRRP